jgi:hypothetical protein
MRARATLILDLGGDDKDFELLAQLDKYRKLLGWSRKYFFLVGVAEFIAKKGDNPDLVIAIADYLETRVH